MNSASIGRRAERSALRYLRKQGLKFVEANYACRAGEIDLIMCDRDVLVFIEVRARNSGRYGGAAASVTPDKQQRIIQTAEHFLLSNPDFRDKSSRFDVLAVQGTHISWLPGAFEC